MGTQSSTARRADAPYQLERGEDGPADTVTRAVATWPAGAAIAQTLTMS